MNRSVQIAFAGAAVLVGSLSTAVSAQDPDSVVAIEPVLVRVLGSTIGTSAPYPVSVVTGPQLTRGTASAFIEEALRAVPGVQIHNRFNFAVGERIAIRGFGARSQFGVRGIRDEARARVAVRIAQRTRPPAQSNAPTHERLARYYQDELMKTEDATEGLASFLEKRRPGWKHR